MTQLIWQVPVMIVFSALAIAALWWLVGGGLESFGCSDQKVALVSALVVTISAAWFLGRDTNIVLVFRPWAVPVHIVRASNLTVFAAAFGLALSFLRDQTSHQRAATIGLIATAAAVIVASVLI